jgi:hypothetical protein
MACVLNFEQPLCRHGTPDDGPHVAVARLGIRLGIRFGVRLGIRYGFSVDALSEDHNAPSTCYLAHQEARTPLGPYCIGIPRS